MWTVNSRVKGWTFFITHRVFFLYICSYFILLCFVTLMHWKFETVKRGGYIPGFWPLGSPSIREGWGLAGWNLQLAYFWHYHRLIVEIAPFVPLLCLLPTKKSGSLLFTYESRHGRDSGVRTSWQFRNIAFSWLAPLDALSRLFGFRFVHIYV